jgi:NADH dehydrogenase FAD-containing subunit
MNTSREKVYIIGNGWSSYYFCKNLDKTKYEPIIIAPNKKVLNTTKLVKYVFDTSTDVEFENPYAEIIDDFLINIDFENKCLILMDKSIPYDKNIVLAIGSEVNYYGVEGAKEHSFPLKTLSDAKNLNYVLNNNLNNPINTINVIGSGPTGIELCSLLDKYNSRFKTSQFFNIKLIEGMDNILPGFSDKTKLDINQYFSKNSSLSIFKNYLVNEILPKHILTADKYDFKSDLTIWTGGVKFNGFGRTLLFDTLNNLLDDKNKITPRGISVNDNFAIDSDKLNKSTNTNIHCLGDMVANKGPPTAQNAKHQAQWLANYFNNNMNINKVEPYKTKSYGKVLHLKDKLYIESDYYTGFMPQWMDTMIEFFY